MLWWKPGFPASSRKEDERRRSLFEHAGSELIESVEAFADQENWIFNQVWRKTKEGAQFQGFYVPVIVTTAQLMVSCCNPSSISLHDGCLSDNAVINEVPYMRFQKSFNLPPSNWITSSPPNGLLSSVKELHDLTERTILVVDATKLQEFLNDFVPSSSNLS